MLEVGKHIDQIWQNGCNDSTFSILSNQRWYEGSTEPKYYSGDKSISYHESDPPMLNFFEYNTFLLPTGYNFSVAEITTNGSSSYKLPFKCADIFSVAIKLKVDILSVSSSSIFTLPLAQSDAMGKFDARFTNNNSLLLTPSYFLCRITNPADNTQYFRSFTISGQTITLNTINTTTPEGISGLAKNWTFELMGAFNMILEGTITPPSILTGICTKNITIGTGEATINFLNRDITGGTTLTLQIVYYALQNSSPQYFNNDSILQHGIYDKAQKIDFPIQQSQLTQLQNNSEKYYQPQRKFTLVTCRPSKLKIDDSIYINVTPYPEGNYKVSSMTERLVHPNGEITGTTFDEVTYEFTNYEFNLDTVILSLKNKDALAKAKVAQITNRTYTITRHTIVTLDRIIVDSTAGGKPPINITKSNITGNSFNASWTVVGTPDSLNLYFTSNYFADSVIIPLANNITTYSFTGLTGATYSFKLTSVTNGRESAFSDTKDVVIAASSKTFSSFIKNHASLAILYDQVAMTGSGLSITDSKNSIVANFYKNTSFDANSAYPTWVTDTIFGNGIKFNAPASALEINENININSRLSGTWLFIIKFREKSQSQFILNKVSGDQYDNNSSYQLYLESNNKVRTILYDEGIAQISYDTTIQDSPLFLEDSDLNKVILMTFKYDVTTHTLKVYKNNIEFEFNYIASKPFTEFTGISGSNLALFIGDYILNNGSSYSSLNLKADIFGIAFIKDDISDLDIQNEAVNMGLINKNDFIIPAGLSSAIWHGVDNMTGSGTSLTDKSGNNNTGTFDSTNTPVWVSSTRWGYGINFNATDRKIIIPNSSSFETYGVNAKLAYLAICKFDTLSGISRFFGLYNNDYVESQYSIVITSGYLEIQMINNSLTSPFVLVPAENISSYLNTTDDFAIAVLSDLENNNFKIIINQITVNAPIQTFNYPSIYFSSITDFKNFGGVINKQLPAVMGNLLGVYSASQYFKGTIWRDLLFVNNIPTESQIKTIFSQMGFI